MDATDSGHASERDPSTGLDATLYPDLVALGGLAAAMTRMSSEHGVDLGQISPPLWTQSATEAYIETDRGTVSVVLVKGRRLFALSLSGVGHLQAGGSTGDLLDVIKAAEAWRDGATLAELAEHFPFVQYDRLAEAFEGGDPVPFGWDRILDDAELREVRPLLTAMLANESLRRLFPTVTHWVSVFLALDPNDRTNGGIWIRKVDDGYTVEATWRDEDVHVRSIAEAVSEAAVQLLDRPASQKD